MAQDAAISKKDAKEAQKLQSFWESIPTNSDYRKMLYEVVAFWSVKHYRLDTEHAVHHYRKKVNTLALAGSLLDDFNDNFFTHGKRTLANQLYSRMKKAKANKKKRSQDAAD